MERPAAEGDPAVTPAEALHQLEQARANRRQAETMERAAILAAREAGATLQAIGDVLGVTRQRACQLVGLARSAV